MARFVIKNRIKDLKNKNFRENGYLFHQNTHPLIH